MSTYFLLITSFLACGVEMVEALTIVLAVGLTRGWRTALIGAGAAFVALTLVVAALGPALVRYVPLHGLQVVVGVLLLIFGLQWLRRAILRAANLKAKHDEDAIFQQELSELGGALDRPGLNWTGFVVSFKGVFLEGLEVAFIVLTFGANAGRFGPSITGAALALILVALIGIFVHRPLSRVPENAVKFAVGLALTSFGTFWGGEGVGVDWSLGEVTIPLLLIAYGLLAALLVGWLKSGGTTRLQPTPEGSQS